MDVAYGKLQEITKAHDFQNKYESFAIVRPPFIFINGKMAIQIEYKTAVSFQKALNKQISKKNTFYNVNCYLCSVRIFFERKIFLYHQTCLRGYDLRTFLGFFPSTQESAKIEFEIIIST